MNFFDRIMQASSLASISALIGTIYAAIHDPSNWQVTVPAILVGVAAIIRNEAGSTTAPK